MQTKPQNNLITFGQQVLSHVDQDLVNEHSACIQAYENFLSDTDKNPIDDNQRFILKLKTTLQFKLYRVNVQQNYDSDITKQEHANSNLQIQILLREHNYDDIKDIILHRNCHKDLIYLILKDKFARLNGLTPTITSAQEGQHYMRLAGVAGLISFIRQIQ